MRRTLAGAPTALAVLAGGYAARARRISVSAATGLKVDTWSTVRQQRSRNFERRGKRREPLASDGSCVALAPTASQDPAAPLLEVWPQQHWSQNESSQA